MATIIQIKGADWSGKGLPVITPLFSDGLVGAFRPSKSIQNTTDLSESGAKISLIGSPVFHENYVECDTANGLATNLNETASMTYAFVGRIESTGDNFGAFFGGSYTGGRGLSMYGTQTGVTSQTFAKRVSDDTYQNETKRIAASSFESKELTNWGFWLVSIDAVNQKVTAYNNQHGFIDLTVPGRDYSDRGGFNRLMYIGKPSYVSQGLYPAKAHIAEALFYNKALTNDEILKVVEVSRKSMKSRGISF